MYFPETFIFFSKSNFVTFILLKNIPLKKLNLHTIIDFSLMFIVRLKLSHSPYFITDHLLQRSATKYVMK